MPEDKKVDKQRISFFGIFLITTTLVFPSILIIFILMEVAAVIFGNVTSDYGLWGRYLAWTVGLGATIYPICWCLSIFPKIQAALNIQEKGK